MYSGLKTHSFTFLPVLKSKFFRKEILIYVFLAFVGIKGFRSNNPADVYLKHHDGKTSVRVDMHYNTYSAQSIEMLNARYISRLKMPGGHPHEWGRNHFFSAAGQAVLQGLIRHPGLFSYWMAQIILALMVLLALGEALIGFSRSVIKTIAALGVWYFIGFTIFSEVVIWNFFSSGTFSIYAGVLLFIEFYRRNILRSIFFSLVLGASVIRLVPLAGISLFFILIFSRREIWSLCKKTASRRIILIFTALFVLYNTVTLFCGEDPDDLSWSLTGPVSVFTTSTDYLTYFVHNGEFISGNPWYRGNVFFRIMGFLSHRITGNNYIQAWDILPGYANRFSRLPEVFIFLAALVFCCVSFFYIRWRQHIISVVRSGPVPYVILLLLPSVFCLCVFNPSVFKLLIIYIPYAVLFIFFVIMSRYDHINVSDAETGSWAKQTVPFFLFISAGGFLIQLSYMTDQIKAPMAQLSWDIPLWAISGIFFCTFRITLKRLAVLLLLLRLISLTFKLNDTHVFLLHRNLIPPRFCDITELIDKNFNRRKYVGADGFTTPEFSNVTSYEIYSLLLGAHMQYQKGIEFSYFNFMPRKALSKKLKQQF